ncbi:hypothetical protein ACOMHN_059536 [Nucella lapillus]
MQRQMPEANIPLSEKALDIVVEKLDADGDGEIDYGELIQGQQFHRRKLTKTIMMSREQRVDMEDTEVGRVRAKLKKLMENQEKSRIRPKSGISLLQGKSSTVMEPSQKPAPTEERSTTLAMPTPSLKKGALLKGLGQGGGGQRQGDGQGEGERQGERQGPRLMTVLKQVKTFGDQIVSQAGKLPLDSQPPFLREFVDEVKTYRAVLNDFDFEAITKNVLERLSGMVDRVGKNLERAGQNSPVQLDNLKQTLENLRAAIEQTMMDTEQAAEEAKETTQEAGTSGESTETAEQTTEPPEAAAVEEEEKLTRELRTLLRMLDSGN